MQNTQTGHRLLVPQYGAEGATHGTVGSLLMPIIGVLNACALRGNGRFVCNNLKRIVGISCEMTEQWSVGPVPLHTYATGTVYAVPVH